MEGSTAAVPRTNQTIQKSEDAYTKELLQQVFPSADVDQPLEASADAALKALSLENLGEHLDKWVDDEVPKQEKPAPQAECTPVRTGRIGPSEVTFDIMANVGTVIVEADRLGISSHSNFSSIRANCCVYQGKWSYELMLGSKGVMQVGWCTIKCKFSQEEGVGDTRDSYAYDGRRQRKWNATTQKYGQCWLVGDVITCAIDCDIGTITFYRNGQCLGEAFNNIKLGQGYAYFPAVSLSQAENLRANFGATPLKYPVEGYKPLQEVPVADVLKTNILLSYLEKALYAFLEDSQNNQVIAGSVEKMVPEPLSDQRSKLATNLLVAAHIFQKVSPYLRSWYVTEACLMKLLLRLNDSSVVHQEQPAIMKLLDLMWGLMQGFEIECCLEHLMVSLHAGYRFSPVTPDFQHAKTYLTVVLAILRHQQTRKYLLEHVLFDKIRLPIFMHVKPPDDACLLQLAPTVWWDMEEEEGDKLQEDDEKKEQYFSACDKLRSKVQEVEEIQLEILKVLLYHKDLAENKTSRLLFIEKFRSFVRENCSLRPIQFNACPLAASLCFYHRMVRVLRYYWDSFQEEDQARFVLSSEAFMPIQEFWADSREYFEFQRCGGSMTHLNRILGAEVNKAQGIKVLKDGKVVPVEKEQPTVSGDYPSTEMPTGNSLMEILDGIMLLYHVAAHKQLGKMDTWRDNMQEFIQSYKDTQAKLKTCPPEMTDVRQELERAKTVFLEKIMDQARQMSWVRAVVYSKSKQEDVAWLWKVALKTVEKASEFKLLFQYMPEFYIEIVLNAYNALKNYFHPTMPLDSIEDYPALIERYAKFLVRHFADNRIVITDSRDNIIQALACFTCYESSLKVLESLPLSICNSFLKSLIAPYENRSWAQTNWILVRIWKGCGFGFRYTHLRHLVPSKVQMTEFGTASLQKPCPSPKFQSLLSDMLTRDSEAATRFLDTLLNQLNWSFSEFIGMMQEIQQVVSRSGGRPLLEQRQMKICATCFEISICLFRVVEMAVTIAPNLFTESSNHSADLLLHRLIQLICLVLNRVTAKHGMYSNVASLYITGLESVTHYPVLAVVAGTLSQLIMSTSEECQKLTTQVLLSDPGFQLQSLEFMLGDNVEGGAAVAQSSSGDKTFDLKNYTEVSEEEVKLVQDLIKHIKTQQQTFVLEEKSISEEDMCTICYAHQRSVIFKPCGHQSCRSCITHQFLSKKECFFCKAIITSLEDIRGKSIPLGHSTTSS